MRTLAEWLQVPIEWLRFGGDEHSLATAGANPTIKAADLKMLSDIQLLDEHHQMMVREFIRILLHANYRQGGGKAVDDRRPSEMAAP